MHLVCRGAGLFLSEEILRRYTSRIKIHRVNSLYLNEGCHPQ
ncbi:hypothetical protein MITSMUL_04122 [Mitsuokella multacida DSM 20544]|uniref:Uncharacterized protein n=1 Tax=Mitsuokella multacida DSM 20544 TaxID=500635 RepID=C9KLN8_9FIRM|nr:hypothetical protein MITSMUL_04122 [Mitsuokella multacida DSM 20544]